jgi:hypothetical protein
MSWLLDLRLIPFFSFYLALVFVLSTALRIRQYRVVLNLVRRMPGRWPKLLRLLREHGSVLLSWETVRPLVVVLTLWLVNFLASQYLWPEAKEFKVRDLLEAWPALPVVLLCGAAMAAFDASGTLQVGQLDLEETEKYFDQAEYWLASWKAPVVRFFTLGYINPRQMVAKEVRAALEGATRLLHSTLWWFSVQTSLRIGFGLSLWLSYALQDWLRGLAGSG